MITFLIFDLELLWSYYLPPHPVKVNTVMQDRGGLINDSFQKASVTDALRMEYLMHDNPLATILCF